MKMKIKELQNVLVDLLNDIKLDSVHKKMWFWLSLAYLIYVLPIIIADRLYCDDLARHLYGASGWKGDGRPVTHYIWSMFSNGEPIVDITPLPLILLAILLSYVVTIYAQHNFTYNHGALVVLSLTTIIMNPFFLQNISYHFDAITMVISICAILLCFSVSIEKMPILLQISFMFLLILISLTSYQPTIGAFAALMMLEVLLSIINNSRINIKLFMIRSISFITSCLFYKIFILRMFLDRGGWRAEAYQFISIGNETAGVFINHILNSWEVVKQYLSCVPVLVIITLAIIYIRFIIGCWCRIKDYRIIKTLYCTFIPFLIISIILFPLLIFNGSASESRMYIAGFTLFILLSIMCTIVGKNEVSVILLVPFICFSYIYSYAYGTMQQSQKEYENYLAYSIISDIEDVTTEQSVEAIFIYGTTPKSPYVERMAEKYPHLYTLVPSYIGNSSWIHGVWLYLYMPYEWPYYTDLTEDAMIIAYSQDPIVNTKLYNMYIYDNTLIIKWNI